MLRNKKPIYSGSGGDNEEEESEEVNIELILAAGLDRGLRMADSERLTMGMWIDYIIEWNNVRVKGKEETDGKKGKPVKVRRATQADYDNF